MSKLSFRLSQAIATGRRDRARPNNREAVLYRLLAKRAAARRAGLNDLEAIIRDQIRWGLPIQRADEAAPPAEPR